MTKAISKVVETNTVVWLPNKNQYVVLENKTASILIDLINEIKIEEIGNRIAKELDVAYEKAIDFVIDIEQKLYLPSLEIENNFAHDYKILDDVFDFEICKIYKVNSIVIKVDYESEYEFSLIHPKFAHLEIKNFDAINHHYKVYTQHNHTFLLVDDVFIGSWHKKDIHYFQGKFSMQIVQHMHNKNEDEWMGVFHASAVSDTKNSILFLGDSGNGKSTSLALLQANGFNCIADDFVPVDAKNKFVYSFPAGISIKKNSLPILLPIYPELENTAEYNFERLNKIVRYLPPNNKDASKSLPCKALVFIKYHPDVEIAVDKISNLEAFQMLVPDSWLSPERENAKTFLNWFSKLPCYQITYSNNDKMIASVSKLFTDEL